MMSPLFRETKHRYAEFRAGYLFETEFLYAEYRRARATLGSHNEICAALEPWADEYSWLKIWGRTGAAAVVRSRLWHRLRVSSMFAQPTEGGAAC